MNHPHRTLLLSLPLLALAAPLLYAQDRRAVHEPVIPPTCITLKATLTNQTATSGEIEAVAGKAGSQGPALDTARIQRAILDCGPGHAVELAADTAAANTAFLSGPLSLRPGVTLLIDQGVTLYAARNPEFYALEPGSCGIVNDTLAPGCRPLISVRSATGSAIMGDGAIDGQGGARMIVDGQPSNKSWWDLAEDARTAGHQQAPRLIDTDLTDDFTLYRITLRNAPNFHVSFHRGDGFTAWGIKVDTPRTARNTDGIDPVESSNITITHSFFRTGDDNVAIKAGDGPSAHITLSHNHFYWGHGLSIGSETNGGVSGIRVEDLSLDGPENGLRIQSNATRGGLVEDVLYEDICIRDAKYPITFDSTFSFPGKGVDQLPVYSGIILRNVRIAGGGKIQFNGFDNTHRVGVTLDGVVATDGPDHYKAQANHTDLIFGPGPVNPVFIGDDSTVNHNQAGGEQAKAKPGKGSLPGCAAKFVPFPVTP